MSAKRQLARMIAGQSGELRINWGVAVVLSVVFIGTGIVLVTGVVGGSEGAFVTRPLGISFIVMPIALIGVSLAIKKVQEGRRQNMEKKGIPATARLISIESTGSRFGESSYGMKMVLEITPPGGKPYRVKKRQFINVSEISAFQPGAVFPVLVDPKNPNKFIFGTSPRTATVTAPAGIQSWVSPTGQAAPPGPQAWGGPASQAAPGTQFLQGPQAAQLLQSLGLGGLASGASSVSVTIDTDESLGHLQQAQQSGGLAPDGQVQLVASTGGDEHEKIQKIIDQADYEVLAHGETAESTILEVRELGIEVSGNPAVDMLVEVRPMGRVPFKAEVSGFVNRVSRHKLQVGNKLIVKYDPTDTTKVAIYHTGPDEGASPPRAFA